MEKNATFSQQTWDLKTKVSSHTFENFDFTNTNFNSGIFDNVNFIDCLFSKSNLSGSKLFYDSNFDRCIFINVNLSNTTFGSHRGIYRSCKFINCNFQGKDFNFTKFYNCIFDKCKLKKINFNASNFNECEFSCSLSDVTFNGMYDTNKGDLPTLNKVSFLNSKLGEFVTFVDCDLAKVTPPKDSSFKDILYELYANNPKILSTGSKDRIVIK